MRSRLLFAVLAVLTLPGCAPRTAGVVLDTRITSPSSLVRGLAAAGAGLASMSARGSLSFESPEGSGSVFVQMAMKKPDSLLLRFRGPFGIEGGTLFLSKEKFLFYNAFENRAVTGKPGAGAIRSVVPFDLAPEEIMQVFCGRFPVVPVDENVRHYDVEGGEFHLTVSSGTDTCEYWIDPEVMMVIRLRRWDSRGEVLVEAEVKDFLEDEGFTVPRRISMAFPRSRRSIAVFYDRVIVNPQELSFSYHVPSSARTEHR
jgi:Domain of unknown function (DUF4292)